MKKSKKKLSRVIEKHRLALDVHHLRFQEMQLEIDDLKSELDSFRQTKLEDIRPPISYFTRADDPESKIRLLNKKLQHLEQQLNNAISGQMIKTREPAPPENPFDFIDRGGESEAYAAAMKRTADFLEAEAAYNKSEKDRTKKPVRKPKPNPNKEDGSELPDQTLPG